MALDTGKMRHVVRIEQRSTAADAAGEPTNTWSLFQQRRAEVQVTPGRELWNAAQRLGRVPTIFKLRYLDGVLPAMRLIHDTRVFNVVSAIDPDGMRVELVITAEELVEETS